MSIDNLTSEQIAVVNHPNGHHAKILAVAGSGKTTTLVYRIKHLVMDSKVSPSSVQVLMFNHLARQQFLDRMIHCDIPLPLQPKVDTFHSFSMGLIQDLMNSGKLPANLEFWIDDKEEKIRIAIVRAISALERDRVIPPDSIEADEAIQAIQLWKGSIIPPSRAGYRGNSNITKVYDAFERERITHHGITYDDFVPIAIAYLEREAQFLGKYSQSLQFLIVDEYQDVNYVQQRLIELLAGRRADVMVVGDDDQTIYEWRGARPNFIIREFQTVFDNKPHTQYTLSHSFRFGPVIAQCAYNTILFNTNRVQKPLVAHSMKKQADVFVYEQTPGQTTDTNKMLTDQVVALVKNKGVQPSKIIVLCRLFAQLCNIEGEFMSRKIPFRVMGQKPFFERHEISVLMDYLRIAMLYSHPIDENVKMIFLNIANTPNRMIARRDLEKLIDGAIYQKTTLEKALDIFVNDPRSPLNERQVEQVLQLMGLLQRISKTIDQKPNTFAYTLLSDLIESLDYLSHFDNYYGKGETSYDRKQTVLSFVSYAKELNLPTIQFIDFIKKLDTTRGAPPDQQIMMTTVFRTKGLEFDYIFIPNCNEGYMPCLYETGNHIFDTSGQVQEPEPSQAIENERRLFYVALTRAKEAVYIGTYSTSSNTNSQFSEANHSSRFIDEIQLKPTVELMGAFQQTANCQADGKNSLVTFAAKHGGIKSLIQNLISTYLVELGDQKLIAKISDIAQSKPATPFIYRFAYPTGKEVEKKNFEERPKLHSSWEDIPF